MNLHNIAELAHSYYTDQGLNISDKKKYLLVVDNARRRVSTLTENAS